MATMIEIDVGAQKRAISIENAVASSVAAVCRQVAERL